MTALVVVASLAAIIAALVTRPPRFLLRPSQGLFILAVYAIGPGLIVNSILKNTFGRVRPRNVAEFGGHLDFTPIWHLGGQCVGNCSFSSGEAASAAAILALVFIAPRSERPIVALGLGTIAGLVSINRIAAGGHFLSDVLMSWILVLATIVILRPLLLGERGAAIDAGFRRIRNRLRERLALSPQPEDLVSPSSSSPGDTHAPRSAKAYSMNSASAKSPPRTFEMVTVVVPAKNEADNLALLVPEIAEALAARRHEIIVVDDGSSDDTAAMLARLRAAGIAVRHIRHKRSSGQSGAVRTGVLMAEGDCIVTIDGDGQNDPAFIPAMVDLLEQGGASRGLVAGQRVGRTDRFAKRLSSRAANRLRTALLNDATRDTGCGLKAVPTALFRTLPYFDGWHRYLPALVLREGLTIAHLDVKDRQRRFGQSNYGIFDRAARGALDLFGVWWLIRRGQRRPGHVEDLTAVQEQTD
nr:glycosyltransferase [Jiella flava]